VISRVIVDRCLGRAFDSFFFLPAVGTRGGILLTCKSEVVALSNPHFSDNAILACVGDVGAIGWWFTGVYGPQSNVGAWEPRRGYEGTAAMPGGEGAPSGAGAWLEVERVMRWVRKRAGGAAHVEASVGCKSSTGAITTVREGRRGGGV
jgi:hypothetical protein